MRKVFKNLGKPYNCINFAIQTCKQFSMKKNILNTASIMVLLVGAVCFTSCNNKKFNVTGNISNAKDSVLYFEDMSLDGPVVKDSVKLSEGGEFSFYAPTTGHPEFYRLRIAGQVINVAADSVETISIKASYPNMSAGYEVSGSEECAKIKELAMLQIGLQAQVMAVVNDMNLGVDAVNDSVMNLVAAYKNNVKVNYIYKQPMKAYAYFALFQTINVGNQSMLIFNPRNNADDVKVYAAVATSWDTYYPKTERGQNLHNIAIQGMKDLRIVQAESQQTIDASKINDSGIIDIALQDNSGKIRRLSDLKGKVVMLEFHLFANEGSMQQIMMLRELYNKYHAQGFEIYQVSIDPEQHFWKTQTAALPWVCVYDPNGTQSSNLVNYNVQNIPTFFLIDKNNVLQKRDVQITDVDAEIKSLL